MTFFKRHFAKLTGTGKESELAEAFEALDEAKNLFVHDGLFEADAFDLVSKPIRTALTKNPQGLSRILQDGQGTARDWVFAQISNIAGDHLESGHFHIYRGVLSTVGPGPALLKIFDRCNDILVESGHIDQEYCSEQKRMLRKNMKEMG